MNYKKIIVYILVVAVLVSSLTFTASAASAVQYPVYNLMDNTYFKLYADGKQIGDTQFDTSYYFEGVRSIHWSWPTDFNSYISTIYVIIECGSTIPTVYLSPWASSPKAYGAAEYVGEVKPGYYMYKEYAFNNGDSFNLTAEYNSPYTGSLNVVSAYGMNKVAEVLDEFYCVFTHYRLTSAGLVPRSEHIGVRTFPHSFSYLATNDHELNFWQYSVAEAIIQSYAFETKLADSISILMRCAPGLLESSDNPVSCFLLDGSNVVAVLPVTYVVSSSSQYWPAGQNFNYFYQYVTATADLSGYDLTGFQIKFAFELENADYGDWSTTQHGTRVEFLSASILPMLEENNSFWGKVLYFFQNIWNSIKEGFASVQTSIASVVTTIENIFTGGDAGEDLNNSGAEIVDQSQILHDANIQLEAVSRPDLDVDNLFGSFLDFDTGGIRMLSVLTSNEYVTPIMVVVFTFSLCGYIFFGRRK